MSDGSSSSRGSSPTRFRPESPSSDAGSPRISSWKPSATPFHPSAFQAAQPATAPVLRQPVGFGTSAPSVPTYDAPPPQTTTAAQLYLPGQSAPETSPSKPRTKSSKAKVKDASKEKPKSSPRKGKQKISASQVFLSQTAPVPLQRTAFRVRKYQNDPTAVGEASNEHAKTGPYGSSYRVTVGDSAQSKGSSKVDSQSQQEAPPQNFRSSTAYLYPYASSVPPLLQTAGTGSQPRSSYYRCDYDEPPPIVLAARAAAEATAKTQHHPSAPAPPQNRYPSPSTPHHPGSHSHNLHSSNRDSAHPQSHTGVQHHHPRSEYHPPETSPPSPPPEDRYSPPQAHAYPSPRQPPVHTPSRAPPAHSPPRVPPAHSPSRPLRAQPSSYSNSHPYAYHPAHPVTYPPPYTHPSYTHSPDKRHKPQPHSLGHGHSQHSFSAPAPANPEVPPPAPRTCRTLTLLIEDKRTGEDEKMLAEVRVPLKQAENDDEGLWADAQEVSEELQKGPSRIDGAAKVYTMRGKYKQYFLRITDDGEAISQPANLKVSDERTLEIFVEDNRPARGKQLDKRPDSSPRRLQRELLTPVTESRASPSPAPVYSPPKRSSLFSVSDASSPVEERFDTSARTPSTTSETRKRHRSSSAHSVQSAYSERHSVQSQEHEATSPSTARSPSLRTTSTPKSRTSSRTMDPPQPLDLQRSPTSPVSRSPNPRYPPDPPWMNPRPPSSQSQKPAPSPTFSQPRSTSSSAPASSAFALDASPPKKPKLSAPQDNAREQTAVSPGPSQPAAHPWSNSRTPSFAESSKAATPAASATSGPTTAKPNPFERFGSTFKFTDASRDATRKTSGITLPSIPSLSTVSTRAAPMFSAPPTTLAPSATSLASSLSGAAMSALDNMVGMWIRGVISKEPQWDAFVKNRTRVLKMAEQLEQYKYVQRIIDRFVGSTTPVDLEGAGGVRITKMQVMRAFNLSLSWGDDCTETLVMTTLYGPGGTRCEDARVCAMLEEAPPITTGMQAKKYLTLLREVHGQWTIAHPDGP